MFDSVETLTDEEPPRDTVTVVLVDISFSSTLTFLVVVIGVVVEVAVLLDRVVYKVMEIGRIKCIKFHLSYLYHIIFLINHLIQYSELFTFDKRSFGSFLGFEIFSLLDESGFGLRLGGVS